MSGSGLKEAADANDDPLYPSGYIVDDRYHPKYSTSPYPVQVIDKSLLHL